MFYQPEEWVLSTGHAFSGVHGNVMHNSDVVLCGGLACASRRRTVRQQNVRPASPRPY